MIFAWGLGQILLGDRHFERVAWGCDFQDHICLGWPILTTFLLGVLLGVDLLGAVRQGCSRVFDISIFVENSFILLKNRGQSLIFSRFMHFLTKNE